MRVGPPDTSLVVNTSKEGTFSIKLFGVDMAGNVQQRPTLFSWTTDRSTFSPSLLSLYLSPSLMESTAVQLFPNHGIHFSLSLRSLCGEVWSHLSLMPRAHRTFV